MYGYYLLRTQIQYFQFADIPKVTVHAESPCYECAEYQLSQILLTLVQLVTLSIMWNSNISLTPDSCQQAITSKTGLFTSSLTFNHLMHGGSFIQS